MPVYRFQKTAALTLASLQRFASPDVTAMSAPQPADMLDVTAPVNSLPDLQEFMIANGYELIATDPPAPLAESAAAVVPPSTSIRENSAKDVLSIGTVLDGTSLQRSGSSLVGVLGLHSPQTVIAAGPDNITLGTDASFASITPGAGTYLVSWNGSVQYPANQDVTASIWAAGVQVVGTERSVSGDAGSLAVTGLASFSSAAVVTVIGGQAIEGRARRSGGTGILNGRTLSVIKVG